MHDGLHPRGHAGREDSTVISISYSWAINFQQANAMAAG
jgi:hypothetical protein